MQRPAGVIAVAVFFVGSAAYLGALGLIRFVDPDAVPLSLGAPLLHGFETSGPIAFLMGAILAGIVGWGLLRLSNLARRAAIVIALAGMVLLVPKISAETSDFSLHFFYAAIAVIVRVMIVWYLWQDRTAEKFAGK